MNPRKEVNIENKAKSNKQTVDLLTKSYIVHKHRIKEYEQNLINISDNNIRCSRYVVSHIENVVEELRERERFIIENEVLNGKEGKWYEGCLSSSSYYRHRDKAYGEFLRCLGL